MNVLIAGFFSLNLLACGDKEEDTATEETEDTSTETVEADLANGEVVHDTRCMGCHANNPAMEDGVPNLTDSELESVIQNGQGSMPGMGLNEIDLRDVIAFLRQEYGG